MENYRLTLLSTGNAEKKAPLLTREDWISTALNLLVAEGIHSVQITVLAKKLGVTRGSFYWHFENRENLLDALIAEWKARNTGIMVETLANSRSLESGILDLFFVWVDHKQFDVELDAAIRNWAQHSKEVQNILQEEDNSRVAAIRDFFVRHKYDATEAFVRARIIYFTQLSYYSLGITEPMSDRLGYLSTYIHSFTGLEINPATSEEFKSRMLLWERENNS